MGSIRAACTRSRRHRGRLRRRRGVLLAATQTFYPVTGSEILLIAFEVVWWAGWQHHGTFLGGILLAVAQLLGARWLGRATRRSPATPSSSRSCSSAAGLLPRTAREDRPARPILAASSSRRLASIWATPALARSSSSSRITRHRPDVEPPGRLRRSGHVRPAALHGRGGYTLAILCERLGLGVWTSFGAAAITCAALSVPIGALTFRLKGGYFAVGSWVVAEVFRLLVGNWAYAATPRACSSARPAGSTPGSSIMWASAGDRRGRAGRGHPPLARRPGLLAVRDARRPPQPRRRRLAVKLLAFVAARGTGLASALISVQTPFIQPNAAFSIQWARRELHGGGRRPRHVEGPIIGAAIYVLVQQGARPERGHQPHRPGRDLRRRHAGRPQGIWGLLRDRLGWTLFPIERRRRVIEYGAGEQVSIAASREGGAVIEILWPGDESRAKLPFHAALGVEELRLIDPDTRVCTSTYFAHRLLRCVSRR